MAGNEWINSYLEAILDAGSSTRKRQIRDDRPGNGKIDKFQENKQQQVVNIKEEKLFSPTKYFVEEVINSFDESDLHRTWVKVINYYLTLFFLTNNYSPINFLGRGERMLSKCSCVCLFLN